MFAKLILLLITVIFIFYVVGSIFENEKSVKVYAFVHIVLLGFAIICITGGIVALIVIL